MARIVIILHLIACVFSEDFVHSNESYIPSPVNIGDIIRIPLIKLRPVVEQNVINNDVKLNRTRRSLFSGRLFNDPFFGGFETSKHNENSLDLVDLFDDMMNGIKINFPGLRLPFRISPFTSAGKSPYDSPFKRVSSTKPTKSTNTNEIINQTPKVIDSTNEIEHNTVPKPNGNSIRLRNFNDTSYAGLMYIGYPNPQEFLMIFDTGSSDIWVPSAKCSRFNSACQQHNRYDSSKSTQYKRDNRKFHITYGTGEVSGFTSIDSVTIANLRIKDQVFGEATKQSGSTFQHAEFDGIFGMGFPSISATDRKSPIDRMFSQGLIKRRVFCFILHHKDGKRAADGKLIGGEMQIGGCDVQPTMYIPLTKESYWQFKMSAVLVSKNDGTVYRACQGGCQAIMDTGTSLITGPADEIRQINQMLGAKKNRYTGEYQIDCRRKNLPTIAFIIQGHRLTLTSDDYILQVRKNFCLSGFMSMESTHGETQWIIGDVFIRTRVTVFDMDNHRIGLAPNKH